MSGKKKITKNRTKKGQEEIVCARIKQTQTKKYEK